jgi:hypothetical protein
VIAQKYIAISSNSAKSISLPRVVSGSNGSAVDTRSRAIQLDEIERRLLDVMLGMLYMDSLAGAARLLCCSGITASTQQYPEHSNKHKSSPSHLHGESLG